MIARIEKTFIDNKVIYEFVECDNLDVLKAKYKKNKSILYVGEILRDRQIKDFKTFGNVVVCKPILEQLDENTIINEVERLTGYRCCITVMPSGTVILNRV